MFALGPFVPLLAHAGHDTGGLWAGLTHPWLGLDHLLAMVMVGLLAARFTQTRERWAVPAGFLVAMAAGAALGFAWPMHPAVEWIISGSVIAIGLALAFAPRVWLTWVLPVVAGAGLFHGFAHAAEATGQAGAYVSGFLLGTAALHGLGLAAGLLTVWRFNEAPVRWTGGVTAAVFAGALVLG